MSLVRMDPVFYIVYIALLFVYASADAQEQTKGSLVEQLNEDNWDLMLTGEWMVEFYAPWCPACKTLEPIWEHLALSKKDLNINIGKIDVTDSPGLSGRFMVTALPTIFHVNNGIFRQYKSSRNKDSLIEFISKKIWMKVEPVPSWKSPTSFHMSLLSQFFKLSQILRSIHNKLLEDIGLPTWGSYLIFAVGTIILGAMLGLFIVCLIDFIYPPKSAHHPNKKKQEKNLEEEDEIAENVGDDLIDEEESEIEDPEVEETKVKEVSSETEETKQPELKQSNSKQSDSKQSDSKQSESKQSESKQSESKQSESKQSELKESEAIEKDKDTQADPNSPSLRKRKPRKAD